MWAQVQYTVSLDTITAFSREARNDKA